MRYVFYLVLIARLGYAQTAQQRTEITPFLINQVILKDTTQVKNMPVYFDTPSEYMTLYQYNSNYKGAEHFLSPLQFEGFKNMMWSLVKSPKSKVYKYSEKKPMSAKELRSRIVLCDSVVESFLDDNGMEVQLHHFMCDSISKLNSIQRLDFYETWYFNPATNMIDRETLGYCAWEYMREANAYRPLFQVFKDQKAADKAQKYLYY